MLVLVVDDKEFLASWLVKADTGSGCGAMESALSQVNLLNPSALAPISSPAAPVTLSLGDEWCNIVEYPAGKLYW